MPISCVRWKTPWVTTPQRPMAAPPTAARRRRTRRRRSAAAGVASTRGGDPSSSSRTPTGRGSTLTPGGQDRERRPLWIGRRPRHDRHGAREPLRVGEDRPRCAAPRRAPAPSRRWRHRRPTGGPRRRAAGRGGRPHPVLPETPGHRLADDDHGLRVRPVGVAEVAAADDLDAGCLEESGCVSGRSASLKWRPRTISMRAPSENPESNLGPVCDESAVTARRLEAGDVEIARAGAEGVQVQAADGADRVDAGQRAEAVKQG